MVNGTSCAQKTSGSLAGNVSAFTIGTLNTCTSDIYFDDIIVSGTSGDFPIGEGKVVGLYPNADGSHGGTWAAGAFKKGTSGATNASRTDTDIWQSLSKPLSTSVGSTWINNVTVTTSYPTDWVSTAYDNMPSETASVNGMMAVFTTHSASATTNNFQLVIDSSSGTNAIFQGDLSESTITVPCAIMTPAAGPPWTKSELDGLLTRFSGSDANPDVYFDGVCLEVDYVPAATGGLALPRRSFKRSRELINIGGF
jgi:hypothetical protein